MNIKHKTRSGEVIDCEFNPTSDDEVFYVDESSNGIARVTVYDNLGQFSYYLESDGTPEEHPEYEGQLKAAISTTPR
jgi:hypothetical protein